jgi:hypothetical protein
VHCVVGSWEREVRCLNPRHFVHFAVRLLKGTYKKNKSCDGFDRRVVQHTEIVLVIP